MAYQIVEKKQLVELKNENALLHRGIETATRKIQEIDSIAFGRRQHTETSTAAMLVEILLKAIEELKEEQKKTDVEEKKRIWVSEGLSKFVDIQRLSATDIQTFYSSLIGNLVQYLNANQGALFLTQVQPDESVTLELMACYAYNRKRFLDKSIQPGEGLIGQCYLEKEYSLYTEIPNGYTTITSGLGESTPNCLLVFPFIIDEKVMGVLEIASFHSIEKHHLDFLQKLGETIASTIYNYATNQRTRELLQTSHEQMEELRAQEEELRQNMEEMSTLQEQIQEQLEATNALKKALEIREEVFGHTTILSESDAYGTITFVNKKLCEVSKYSKEELIGKGHNIFRHPEMPASLFKTMWESIKRGKIFRGIVKNRAKDGTHYWVDATIVPIKNSDGTIVKYIGARYHIKDDVLAETMYAKQMEELVTI